MTIQSEAEEKKVLELIVAASEEFLQSTGSNLNYRKITDTILYISGAKYASFDLYDEDGTKFRTMVLSAPEGMIKKAASLLGFKLPGKVWDADPVRDRKLKSSTITHFSSLLELTGDVLPKPVISLFEKTFGIGEVILVKILKENTMIGNFTLIMPKNVGLKNENYVELYSRQVGLLITRSRSEGALRKSEEKFSRAFHSGTLLMAISTVQEGLYIDVNNAFLKVLGFKREEVIGRKSSDLNMFAKNEQREEIKERFRKEGRVSDAEVQIKGHDGLLHTGIFTADPIDVEGTPCWLTTMTDITDRKKAEEALQESEEKFRNLALMLPEVVFEMNIHGTLTFVNQQAFKIFGYTQQDFDLGINALDMLIPEDRDKALRVMQLIIQGGNSVPNEYTALRINGSTFPILISSVAIIREGRAVGLRGLIFDITERRHAEEALIHLSFHDHLTGLYNRRFFEEELKRLDTERQLPLSFIMGDLNSLKIINDVFGHNRGDDLLKEVAEILKSVCRSDDILARWGGDEFVIILPKISAADTEDIVKRIKSECDKTSRQKIPASLSLGAATKEKAGQDIQSIVIDAESNMYKNKLAQKDSLTSSIIFALEQALYEKSSETKEHTDRMHDFALKLGKSAGLSSQLLDELSLLATLHDIGKVAIPETILLKKGKLTVKEWSVVKRHPEIGFNIAQSSPQIAHIAKSILSCHENWDGSGYPLGIKGHEIPVISRIILIADAYDVMTSGRTYKPVMSKEDAIEELKICAGTQFDPELVDKAIEILSK